MGCCGGKRAIHRDERKRQEQPATDRSREKRHVPDQGKVKIVYFKYIGKRGLTVLGPVTHEAYHFTSAKQVLGVDMRDSRALMGIPNLVRITGQE